MTVPIYNRVDFNSNGLKTQLDWPSIKCRFLSQGQKNKAWMNDVIKHIAALTYILITLFRPIHFV